MYSPRRGTSLLDYALVVLFIAILLVGTVTALGEKVGDPFGTVDSAFNGAAGASEVPTPPPSVAPDASFSFSPSTPSVGAVVGFSGPTSDVDSWSWDFGDGGNSTEQDPSHTYANSGTYTANLALRHRGL